MAKQKRASLPDDTFGSQSRALDRLTSAEPAMPEIESYQEPEQQKVKLRKSSVYLTKEQEQKLDDLAYEHRKATGESTNKQDVIRMLVEKAALSALLEP
jgi:hypothetical protein